MTRILLGLSSTIDRINPTDKILSFFFFFFFLLILSLLSTQSNIFFFSYLFVAFFYSLRQAEEKLETPEDLVPIQLTGEFYSVSFMNSSDR